jgi:hypothetical protein
MKKSIHLNYVKLRWMVKMFNEMFYVVKFFEA